jgi:hypothetical protein
MKNISIEQLNENYQNRIINLLKEKESIEYTNREVGGSFDEHSNFRLYIIRGKLELLNELILGSKNK